MAWTAKNTWENTTYALTFYNQLFSILKNAKESWSGADDVFNQE